MEVLKKGREGKGWYVDLSCTGAGTSNHDNGCGAQLRIRADDVYQTSSRCWAYGDITYYRLFCCPECGVETKIPSSVKVPQILGVRPSATAMKARMLGKEV